MIASGTANARVPSVASSSAYAWSFPGAPIRILIDLRVIAEIRRNIGLSSATPIIGLLLGSAHDEAVHIHEIVPLSRGDAEEFESVVAAHANSADSVPLGCYVAEARESLRLGPAEINLAERFFPEPHSVILLIQTGHGPIPNATFFFWDGGQFLGDFAFLEFPFDRALLEKEVALNAPQVAAEHRIAAERPRGDVSGPPIRRKYHHWMGALALVCMLTVLAVVAFWGWPQWKSSLEPARTPAFHTENVIGLRAERSGTDFRLSWDRNSQLVRDATWGSLSIEEGGRKRDVALQRDDLRGGSVLFEPQSARVQIQLSLVMPDQTLRSESVLLLLSESGPIKVEQRTSGTSNRKNYPAPVNNSAPEASMLSSASDANAGRSPVRVFTPPQRSSLPLTQTMLSAPAFQMDIAALSHKSEKLGDLPVVPPPPIEKKPGAEEGSPPAKTPETLVYIGATPITQPKPTLTNMLRAFLTGEKTVSVRVRVDERGVVTRAEAIPEHGLSQYLITVSQSTAMMWRFRPATRNGKPVPSDYIVGFHFNP
jgi:hypothetical protein